jgi:hypothetical protein
MTIRQIVRLILTYLRYWVLGYTEDCTLCNYPLKGPMFKGRVTKRDYWKYCPRCGDEMWTEEEEEEEYTSPNYDMFDQYAKYQALIKCVVSEDLPKEGQPVLFGFCGRDFVAFSELLNYPNSENSVQIFDDQDKLVESFCEPMSTRNIIDMFCEEYEAGRATTTKRHYYEVCEVGDYDMQTALYKLRCSCGHDWNLYMDVQTDEPHPYEQECPKCGALELEHKED